jgi:hypothetical protein
VDDEISDANASGLPRPLERADRSTFDHLTADLRRFRGEPIGRIDVDDLGREWLRTVENLQFGRLLSDVATAAGGLVNLADMGGQLAHAVPVNS